MTVGPLPVLEAQMMRQHGFKTLTTLEEQQYRQWARAHYCPTPPPDFEQYHPVIRDEWRRIEAGTPSRATPSHAKMQLMRSPARKI